MSIICAKSVRATTPILPLYCHFLLIVIELEEDDDDVQAKRVERLEQSLFDMTGAAEQIASAGGIDSIHSEQRIAGRGAALQFMHIVAGSAFDLMVEQQGLINRLADQAGAAPIERHRGGADC